MAKTSTLIDDFSDGVIGGIWSTLGTVVETSDQARLTPTTSGSFLAATTTYDLSFSFIVAHVPTITADGITGTLQSGLALQSSSTTNVYIRKIGSQLVVGYTLSGTDFPQSFTPYSAVNHLYWRIRADTSNIYWETSSTGTGYFIQATLSIASLGFAITALQPYFVASYSGFEPSPGILAIEAVNPGHAITATGASTSSGNAQLLIKHAITGSGASTSTGSAAITIPPLTAHALTGSGASTSSGTAAIVIIPVVALTHQISASGASTSSGSASFTLAGTFTASGASFSNGDAAISIVHISSAPRTFTFHPPIVYDVPPTLPGDPRNRLARWYNNRPRGRSVLKLSSATSALYPSNALFPSDSLFPLITTGEDTYMVVDIPTIDQMNAAVLTYMGGRIYNIDSNEANSLLNAGFSVIQEINGEIEVLTPGDAV